MKHLLFLAAIFFALHSNAQTVFAPPNSIWYTERIVDTEGGDNYSLFETIKDTLFEGKICSKIIGQEFSTTSPNKMLETQYLYTNNDTVFYYNHIFKIFYPLYIFNVKKGDTIIYNVPFVWIVGAKSTFRVVVDSVDTITIDGLKLRRVKSEGLDDFIIGEYIERLGSVYATGLISPKLIHSTLSGGGIRCYKDGIIDTNLNTKGWACDYLKTTSIKAQPNSSTFATFPNPFTENITFNNPFDFVAVTIYNIEGKKMIQSFFENKNVCTVMTNHLNPGLYYLKFTDKTDKTLFSSTIIKINY